MRCRLPAVAAVTALVLVLAGCGGGEKLESQKITILVGGGGEARDAQAVVNQFGGIRIGNEELVGTVRCQGSNTWVLEHTTQLSRAVTTGEEAVVTLTGPAGSVDCAFKFPGMFTNKNDCRLGDTDIDVHCYYSSGSKWALIVYVR